MISPHEKTITPEEAFRAIYLDLESLVKEPPALLGWACEFDFQQVVLDERLEIFARESHLRVRSLSDVLGQLLGRCRDEDRPLVCYSQSEKSTVAEETGHSAHDVYRDARAIAKRWINRLHPEPSRSHGEWKLRHLLEFIGFPWPRELGHQKATKKIRYATEQALKKDSYDDVSAGGKRHWTNLLKYNQIDTLGMRDLTMRAAAELAVAEDHGIYVDRSG